MEYKGKKYTRIERDCSRKDICNKCDFKSRNGENGGCNSPEFPMCATYDCYYKEVK